MIQIEGENALLSTHRVHIPVLLRVVRFPPTGGEDVLVAFIPGTKNNLPSM